MTKRWDWKDYRASEYGDIDPMKTIAILPTAAVEQHGPHLPVGTDTIISQGMQALLKATCPQDMDLTFVATLQRALKARGYYDMPVTGQMTPATAEAVRRYQADRGLDSHILSLAAARQLGLATSAAPE